MPAKKKAAKKVVKKKEEEPLPDLGHYGNQVRALAMLKGLNPREKHIEDLVHEIIAFMVQEVGAARQENITNWVETREIPGDQKKTHINIQTDLLAMFDKKVMDAYVEGAKFLVADFEENYKEFGLKQAKMKKMLAVFNTRFDPQPIPTEV